MKRRLFPTRVIALALALLATVGPVWAGGGGFGSDEDDGKDAGPPFFGIVRDKDGNPLADAKITVVIAKSNSTLVLRADSQGHFFVRGFDKSIDPNDVEISCSKEAYRNMVGTKGPSSGAAAPIEVICVLEHE